MLEDEVLYTAQGDAPVGWSLNNPYLLRNEKLGALFGVPIYPIGIDELICRYSRVLRDFIEQEAINVFLILQESNEDEINSMRSRPGEARQTLFQLFVQVFASSLLNAKEYDKDCVDRIMLQTSMVIFDHVKASKNQGSRKKLSTLCRLFSLLGDAVSFVFMEALRTTVVLAHHLVTSGQMDWDSALNQDFHQLVTQIKREGDMKHRDLDDLERKIQEESPIAVLIALRLGELIEHVVNRVAAFPSPVIDSRYSILGFYDSHSKKSWTDLVVNAEFVRLRKTASVSRSTIGDQPLGWMSLLHVASFADNQVFDQYHGQIVIPLALPLTVDAPSEASFPVPFLARQAVKTRTKTKFTLPNASLIREAPLGWSRMIQATLLILTVDSLGSTPESMQRQVRQLLSKDVEIDDSVDGMNTVEEILLRVAVEGELDGRRLCRLLLLLVGDRFLGTRPDGRPHYEGVNPKAVLLYKWVLKWFHPCIIREAVLSLLASHTRILLTPSPLGHSGPSPDEAPPATESFGVFVDYDDKLISSWTPGKHEMSKPMADVSHLQAAMGRSAAVSLMANDFAFPTQCREMLTPGFHALLCLLVLDSVIDFQELWAALIPSDDTLRVISELILLCHQMEKNPLLGKHKREDYINRLRDKRTLAELSVFWPDWRSHDATTCETTIHGSFQCSKTMLLAAALSMNLRHLSLSILDKFGASQFPYNRGPSMRKAFGRVVRRCFCPSATVASSRHMGNLFPTIEIGEILGAAWPRIDSYESFVSEGSLLLQPMAGWMETTMEPYEVIAQYAKEHVSRLVRASTGNAKVVDDPLLRHLILEVMFPALLLSPVPSEPPNTLPFSAHPPASLNSRKDSAEPLPQALVLSDLIWEVLGHELSASDRYSLYIDFFLDKLKSIPLRHYSAGDRKTVNKALKKVTAAEISPTTAAAPISTTTQTASVGHSTAPADSTQLINYVIGSKKPRQLSKKDRNISAIICRYACNNPFETLDCVLHHIELFDPLVIKVVLEYLRSLTRLGADVAMFIIIERQQNRELLLGGEWNLVSSKPKRLRNVAIFTARFLRRFPWVLPKPMLVSIVSRMVTAVNESTFPRNVSGIFGDYVYIQEILSWVGSCPCLSVSEISELQYEALSGGTFLRKIVFTDEDIRDEELRPCGGQCRTSLRDCLIDPAIFKGLVFSLCKMSLALSLECDPASMRLNIKDQLRAIQESVDSVDSCLSHVMDFITLPSPMISVSKSHVVETTPSRSTRILPMSIWPSLFQHCHLAIAWLLIRWVAPPAIIYDQVKGQKLVFGARVTRAEWSDFVDSFVTKELVDESDNATDHKVRFISLEGYLAFWQLSLIELMNPVKLYHSQIQRLQDELRSVEGQKRQLSNSNDLNSVKDLERKERKLKEAKDTLEKEKEVKQSITASVRFCINNSSCDWFQRDPSWAEQASSVMHHMDPTISEKFALYSDVRCCCEFLCKMVFPRAISSASDAIYCAEFCIHLIEAAPPGLHLVSLTFLAVKIVAPLLMSCTDRESDNLSIFIIRVLQYVQSLVANVSHLRSKPSFKLPPWEDTLMDEVQLGQLLSLLETELGSHVIEHALELPTASEEDSEVVTSAWFTIRRALRFLNQSAKVFPATKMLSGRLTLKLQAITDFATQDWKDIIALTKALDKRVSSTRKVDIVLNPPLEKTLSKEQDINMSVLQVMRSFAAKDEPIIEPEVIDADVEIRSARTSNEEARSDEASGENLGTRKRRRLPDDQMETTGSKSPTSRMPPKTSDQAKPPRGHLEQGDETEERLKLRALQKWYDRRQNVPRVNTQTASMTVAAAAVNRKQSEIQADAIRKLQMTPRTTATSKAIHQLSSNIRSAREPSMPRLMETRPLPMLAADQGRKPLPYSAPSASLARSKDHGEATAEPYPVGGVKRRRSGYEQTLHRPLEERKRPLELPVMPAVKGFSPRREEWPQNRHEAWHVTRPHYGQFDNYNPARQPQFHAGTRPRQEPLPNFPPRRM
eukprot:Gregarina_sp_Poly_1__5515@NODE_290_length_9967_cov_88_266061_g251_i0_p1_GENE_NODE_290_length_9967_cov_88_266061_g251_i0NODE_290_length_9967_cov_88_266061_g251_i0_p1_ORF_typecomplete_len1993_score305_01Tho2/PF11262_8/1_5e37THOC2_N/PF16134_5/7_4e05THOC2_N/PF16134_5/0_9Thoc2/PF11732_8/9_1e07Thoc2/PF11732_8/4e03SPX/PF03105_19/5_2SPX/PF03105_19/1_4e02EMC3_TMCO1/PF01956_16/0_16EMC3_TMCO1/PF01956_16/1_4e04_NODE_290_length_9967_cov_88_266061_g251_i016747652